MKSNLLPFLPNTIQNTFFSNFGIGYEYNGIGANPASDLTYLKSIGVTKIRLNIVDYTDSASITAWRAILNTALALGFTTVIYGLSSNPTIITAANVNAFFTALQAEATYCQSLNNPSLVFQMGNEEQLHVDGTTITNAQIKTDLLSWVTTIKGIYTVGKVIYSVDRGNYPSWKASGIGALDILGVNQYDTLANFTTQIPVYIADFGSKIWVTEWNSGNGFSDFNNEGLYAADLLARLNVLKNNGISEFFVFLFMDHNNGFGLKQTSGIFRQAWQSLLAGV